MTRPPRIALVDANNFYATCETVFEPALAGRPLVVLSNNDGCIVARSAEAKALGIPMAAPIHEWRDFCRQHAVVIRSSNYTLYGDMSARMLSVLQDCCPQVESYSIDESFLDLSGMDEVAPFAQALRQTLRQRVHITCGIGIGPSKTLAKFANLVAKKQPVWGGVYVINDHPPAAVADQMAQFPVTEVWGVGRRLGARLAVDGVHTVHDLCTANPEAIRRRYGVVLEKTVHELNGRACLQLTEVDPPRQQIMASRSFGQVLTDPVPIRAALSHHVSHAAEKLRRQGGVAQHVYVMLRTNPFRLQDTQYRRTALVPLAAPTADTSRLLAAARAGFDQLFQPGLRYHKVGVMLSQITPAEAPQADLFAVGDDPRRQRLMALVDRINQSRGRGTLTFASTGLDARWQMRTANRSPCYTTCWEQLPVAYCR